MEMLDLILDSTNVREILDRILYSTNVSEKMLDLILQVDSTKEREILDLILYSTNAGEMLDRTVFWILLIFEGNAGSYSGLY
jgi:hypothetical protein